MLCPVCKQGGVEWELTESLEKAQQPRTWRIRRECTVCHVRLWGLVKEAVEIQEIHDERGLKCCRCGDMATQLYLDKAGDDLVCVRCKSEEAQ